VNGAMLRRRTFCGTWCRTFATCTFAWVASLALTQGQRTSAQPPQRPDINVARTISAQPATQVPFPIRVGHVPRNSFVRLRGLPPKATLSEGHAIAPGVWAVPLHVLPHLTITLPATVTGSADVTVTLIGSDGSALVEARCTLVVAAPSALPPPTPYDRERALRFLQKGNEQLAQGAVGPARVLYERAAYLGLAEAAIALGGTYDAVELSRPHLRGVLPDAAAAAHWYERARALGADDAEQRLQRLQGN
jgi:hypothetical protein